MTQLRTAKAFGLLALACGAGSLTSGCAAMALGAAATGSVVAMKDRTLGQSLDDAAASNKVKTKLMAFDSRAFADVDVEVSGGRLLLSGAAPTEQHRMDAERIAWSAASVEQVVNQIQIGGRGGAGRTALDHWITTQLRARYMADASVKGVNINIETQDGVVYLMGLARSEAEARRAAETASHIGGVKKVVSYIEVRETRGPASYGSGAPIEQGGAVAAAQPYAPRYQPGQPVFPQAYQPPYEAPPATEPGFSQAEPQGAPLALSPSPY